jgi:hypothetical protein
MMSDIRGRHQGAQFSTCLETFLTSIAGDVAIEAAR